MFAHGYLSTSLIYVPQERSSNQNALADRHAPRLYPLVPGGVAATLLEDRGGLEIKQRGAGHSAGERAGFRLLSAQLPARHAGGSHEPQETAGAGSGHQ